MKCVTCFDSFLQLACVTRTVTPSMALTLRGCFPWCWDMKEGVWWRVWGRESPPSSQVGVSWCCVGYLPSMPHISPLFRSLFHLYFSVRVNAVFERYYAFFRSFAASRWHSFSSFTKSLQRNSTVVRNCFLALEQLPEWDLYKLHLTLIT